MNDTDTKFIMEEEIKEEKNENDSNYGGDLLFSAANNDVLFFTKLITINHIEITIYHFLLILIKINKHK